MALSPQDISAARQAIEEHQRLLVLPHANVDPDGLSSALACYLLFQDLGKDVTVVCPDTLPESLNFLPGFEKLALDIVGSQQFVITINLEDGVEIDKLRYAVEDRKVNIIVVPKEGTIREQQISFGEGERPYDLIVAVDTADLPLFGSLYRKHIDFFGHVPIMNIDHHISNTRYGQLHLIDPTSASATEVLYQLFTHVSGWKERMTPDIATLLLTGLITDTRSFQNPNTTPRSLEVAANLLQYGARQQEIIQHIYKTKPLSTLKIWGRALNRIQMDPRHRIVWSSVSKEDLAEMGAQSKETHGILDELISTIPDADLHILFTEVEDGGLKASMRSSAAIDSSALAAKLFGGGGHPRAAGFRIAHCENFALQVLTCIQQFVEGMRIQREEQNAPVTGSVVSAIQRPVVREEGILERQETSPPPVQKPRAVDIIEEIQGQAKTLETPPTDIVQDLTKEQGAM